MSQQDLVEDQDREVRSLSPEQRRKDARHLRDRLEDQVGPGTRAWEVAKRTLVGTYNDGFIHAGNLAYLSMLAIFPFFILGAAVFSAFGEEAERAATINAVLSAMPPVVGNVIEPVARDAIEARKGGPHGDAVDGRHPLTHALYQRHHRSAGQDGGARPARLLGRRRALLGGRRYLDARRC